MVFLVVLVVLYSVLKEMWRDTNLGPTIMQGYLVVLLPLRTQNNTMAAADMALLAHEHFSKPPFKS